jgi:hypothetical protein
VVFLVAAGRSRTSPGTGCGQRGPWECTVLPVDGLTDRTGEMPCTCIREREEARAKAGLIGSIPGQEGFRATVAESATVRVEGETLSCAAQSSGRPMGRER